MIIYTQAFLAAAAAAGQPLTKARIGYQVHSRDLGLGAAAVTVSTEDPAGPRDAPLRPDTAEYWLPTALPATWTLDLGTLFDVDYVGVAGHTIGSEACGLLVETSQDGSTWTTFAADVSPADDTPILFLDDSRSIRYVRLTLTGLGDPARLGVVYVGQALAMPEPIDGAYTPITMSRETVLRTQQTRGGQFIGQSLKRYGVSGDATFKNLTASFVRSDFDPFVKSARQYPYFFAWCPQYFPLEVGYCWAPKDIRPKYMGIADYMQVNWSMNGLGAA